MGILANDTDLVRRAYLLFYRYMSAIRKDGGPAIDSLRNCYAADYVARAGTFSGDFLHQWQHIALIDDCCREDLCLIPDTSISGTRIVRELDAHMRVYGKPEGLLAGLVSIDIW